MGFLIAEHLTKSYPSPRGNVVALKDVSICAEKGEFVSIVGSSGCGKSTLLLLLGGLLQPTSGEVLVDGERIQGPNRQAGFVFQKPVLLRWRTVLDNVLLPIEVMKDGQAKRRQMRGVAKEMLSLVGLGNYVDHYPHELSGGMQQRVAIARALIYDPALLLMDEPFGALDALLREQMNLELIGIWERSGKTIVFVTHDIEEAVFLSTKLIVLSGSPGCVNETIRVPFPLPRCVELKYTAEFGALRARVRASLSGGDR